jgi:hypothetical protein
MTDREDFCQFWGVSLSCMTRSQITSTGVQGPLQVGHHDSDSGHCQQAHVRPGQHRLRPSHPHGGSHPSRAGPACGCEPESRTVGPGAGPSEPGRSRIECVGPEAGAGPIALSRAVSLESLDRVESGARVCRAGDVRGGRPGHCVGGGEWPSARTRSASRPAAARPPRRGHECGRGPPAEPPPRSWPARSAGPGRRRRIRWGPCGGRARADGAESQTERAQKLGQEAAGNSSTPQGTFGHSCAAPSHWSPAKGHTKCWKCGLCDCDGSGPNRQLRSCDSAQARRVHLA